MLQSRASRPATSRPQSLPTRAPVRRISSSPPKEAQRVRGAVSRPFLLLVIMVLCAGSLVSRLVFWQVMQNGHLTAMANAEHAALNVQAPMRGQIFDANGNPLATDINMNLVYAVPRNIKQPVRTAELLAPVLGQSVKRLEELFTTDAGVYTLLAPPIDEATTQQVKNLALPGIVLDPQVRRDYPENSLASQLLGFVNVDQQGQYGIEGYYNNLLSGTAGLRSVLRDTAGNDIHLGSSITAPSHDGAQLDLTIDSGVQAVVEDELQKAVKAHSADGGTAIVMDPRTGYILGMASTPTYNPNRYAQIAQTHPDRFSNPAIQWTYEPGSTFKIITMAAGLDTHTITPQSAFLDTGSFYIAGATIHNWNMSGFGWETMTQVLQHSANVGASWVAGRLGTNLFYKYVKAFQFGRPTGVDLAGDGAGLLPLPGSKSWTIVNLYTNSFGQGISVTPLQLIRAVAAVANGGELMKPQLVKRLVYDGRVIDRPPVAEGRVVSPQSAHTLTDMLLHSAINGEAQLGLVKGYNIAAKTGTANIAGPGGRYIQGATIASIIGYAPAFHPRFIVLVIIRHPRDTPWGSMAAAPVLHNIFEDLFMHYHIPPTPHALYR